MSTQIRVGKIDWFLQVYRLDNGSSEWHEKCIWLETVGNIIGCVLLVVL